MIEHASRLGLRLFFAAGIFACHSPAPEKSKSVASSISPPAIPSAASNEPAIDFRVLRAAMMPEQQSEVLLKSCPADLIPKAGLVREDGTAARMDCHGDLALSRCITMCVAGQSRNACLEAALALQENKETRAAEVYFALGCKQGNAAACTNRASGMEVLEARADDSESCMLRTHAATCRADYGWGCAMEAFMRSNSQDPGELKLAKAAADRVERICAPMQADPSCVEIAGLLKKIRPRLTGL